MTIPRAAPLVRRCGAPGRSTKIRSPRTRPSSDRARWRSGSYRRSSACSLTDRPGTGQKYISEVPPAASVFTSSCEDRADLSYYALFRGRNSSRRRPRASMRSACGLLFDGWLAALLPGDRARTDRHRRDPQRGVPCADHPVSLACSCTSSFPSCSTRGGARHPRVPRGDGA